MRLTSVFLNLVGFDPMAVISSKMFGIGQFANLSIFRLASTLGSLALSLANLFNAGRAKPKLCWGKSRNAGPFRAEKIVNIFSIAAQQRGNSSMVSVGSFPSGNRLNAPGGFLLGPGVRKKASWGGTAPGGQQAQTALLYKFSAR